MGNQLAVVKSPAAGRLFDDWDGNRFPLHSVEQVDDPAVDVRLEIHVARWRNDVAGAARDS